MLRWQRALSGVGVCSEIDDRELGYEGIVELV